VNATVKEAVQFSFYVATYIRSIVFFSVIQLTVSKAQHLTYGHHSWVNFKRMISIVFW